MCYGAKWMALLTVGLIAGVGFGGEPFFEEDFEAPEVTGWQSAGANAPVVVSGVWQRMVCKFNSRENHRVNLSIGTDKGSIGSVWIDGFNSVPAVPVSNPGFEDGLVGWNIVRGNPDTAVASEGRQSIRMTLPLESDPPVTVQRMIEVTPNTDYEFKIDMLVDGNFQGDCKFLVFDESGMHCIMANYGEPFAARVVESRERNGGRVVGMNAAPGRPAQLVRRIELPETATNINFRVDCNVRAFNGSFTATLADPVSGDVLLQLKPDAKNEGWQTLSGIGVAGGGPLELTLRAEGEGVVEVDNVLLTPPRLIPEPQHVTWYPARENFVLPETLTVAISGGAGAVVLDGAMELLEKDLTALGKKLVRTDAADALLNISIDGKYAVPDGPREGYTLHVDAHGIAIQSGTAAGAFYGVMSVLGLIGRYGAEEALPGCDMTDYPSLALRGFLYAPGPEQCARLKLNFYMTSTGYPESEADIAATDRVAEECRKYNLEFVSMLGTVSCGYYVESKNPSLAVGQFVADEAVALNGVKPAELAHPYVIRTALSGITVRNTAGTHTYQEGRDYTVIPGDMAFPYNQPESARHFAIARTPDSGIADGETVSVSYDAARASGSVPYCPLEPEVGTLNEAFFRDFTGRYGLNYMHPLLCLMEFAERDQLMSTDSRVIRSGESPLALCVRDMLHTLDIMQQVNPDAKVLFFTGTVNDYARQAAPLLQARAKDLVAVIWGYDAEWPNAYGVEVMKFWSGYGIASVTMPWGNRRNINGHIQLAKQAAALDMPCLGTIGSNWPEGPGDLVETASSAWRAPRPGEKKYVPIKNLQDKAGIR